MRLLATAMLLLALFATSRPGDARAATLENVQLRQKLVCGVSRDVAGFAALDSSGRWSGFDVDFCRALAAAVIGDGSLVEFRAVENASGLRALAAGEVDVLGASTSWTLSRDTELSIRFVDVLLFDGQSFLVPRGHGLASALELSGASVCVAGGTRAADAVEAYFSRQRMRHQLVVSEHWGDLVATYAAGGCTALSADLTTLAAVRAKLANPTDHMLLPEIVSKEPRGPAVRIGDERWFAIVRWVVSALVEAEELQITRDNATSRLQSQQADIRRFLGVGTDLGHPLGLASDWAYRAVLAVGNYGEIFERWLGANSPLRLPRGQNRLWSQGGLMYAVPMR